MPIIQNNSRGSAIKWSKEDIEKLAEVSEADKESAAVFWRKHAENEAKNILDAETEEICVEGGSRSLPWNGWTICTL